MYEGDEYGVSYMGVILISIALIVALLSMYDHVALVDGRIFSLFARPLYRLASAAVRGCIFLGQVLFGLLRLSVSLFTSALINIKYRRNSREDWRFHEAPHMYVAPMELPLPAVYPQDEHDRYIPEAVQTRQSLQRYRIPPSRYTAPRRQAQPPPGTVSPWPELMKVAFCNFQEMLDSISPADPAGAAEKLRTLIKWRAEWHARWAFPMPLMSYHGPDGGIEEGVDPYTKLQWLEANYSHNVLYPQDQQPVPPQQQQHQHQHPAVYQEQQPALYQGQQDAPIDPPSPSIPNITPSSSITNITAGVAELSLESPAEDVDMVDAPEDVVETFVLEDVSMESPLGNVFVVALPEDVFVAALTEDVSMETPLGDVFVAALSEDLDMEAPFEDVFMMAPSEDVDMMAPLEDVDMDAPLEDVIMTAPLEDAIMTAPSEDVEMEAPPTVSPPSNAPLAFPMAPLPAGPVIPTPLAAPPLSNAPIAFTMAFPPAGPSTQLPPAAPPKSNAPIAFTMAPPPAGPSAQSLPAAPPKSVTPIAFPMAPPPKSNAPIASTMAPPPAAPSTQHPPAAPPKSNAPIAFTMAPPPAGPPTQPPSAAPPKIYAPSPSTVASPYSPGPSSQIPPAAPPKSNAPIAFTMASPYPAGPSTQSLSSAYTKSYASTATPTAPPFAPTAPGLLTPTATTPAPNPFLQPKKSLEQSFVEARIQMTAQMGKVRGGDDYSTDTDFGKVVMAPLVRIFAQLAEARSSIFAHGGSKFAFTHSRLQQKCGELERDMEERRPVGLGIGAQRIFDDVKRAAKEWAGKVVEIEF
ncbi:hypothetical protein LTR66_005817 [Elasticomyces elasticus]|nr:hypothetical protein LTR66_005817 [Elasticomyces elasticus]